MDREVGLGVVGRFVAEARGWCRGRLWQGRVLLLAWFAYMLVHHLRDDEYTSLIGALNLGIHELGHLVTRPFGEWISIAGGTLVQCLVPVGSMFMFYRQRDFFAIAVAWGWLATNLFNVATYMADARSMALPLVSVGGGEAYHDWNYLLDSCGLLRFDKKLAFLVRGAATLSMLVCLVGGGWLVAWMLHTSGEPVQGREE